LYRQFELLKVKAGSPWLFDAARKKSLPRIPDCIGVITSSTGAALQRYFDDLRSSFSFDPCHVYPSDVQGKQAAPQLIKACSVRIRRGDVMCLFWRVGVEVLRICGRLMMNI